MNTTDPAGTVDLLNTQHLGSFLVVLALGAIIGVLAVLAVMHWPSDYDDEYDDWPDDDEQPAEPHTVRIPRVRPEWQQ